MGRIEFNVWVAPADGRRRRVAVVGQAGTTIVDDLAEIEEFANAPWSSDQVSGQIVFEALQQSAGRRAVLRDREVFPVFLDAVGVIEPMVSHAVAKISREVDEQTADRLADQLRRIFGRVLKELADLDNPTRSPVGSEAGEGALFEPTADEPSAPGEPAASPEPATPGEVPAVPELDRPPEERPAAAAQSDRRRTSELPSVAPDPDPGDARSRFDADAGIVLYNDRHGDYLTAKDDDVALLDYLATLVAKEYVLHNNP